MKLLSTNAKLSKTAGGAANYLAAGLTLAKISTRLASSLVNGRANQLNRRAL